MSTNSKENLVGILIFCLALLTAEATAQKLYFKKYGVGQGLTTDIIKSCVQDSLGYFWLATDAGIVQYDGVSFSPHRKAMRGNYAKGFFTTAKGRLFAFGDLDFIEIHNLGDSVRFTSLCPVAHEASDSTLAYPKLIYEDKNKTLWISESQSVVKLQGKKLKRYEFSLADRTSGFLRSFQFFEDKQDQLYVVSIHGKVFRYNVRIDQFESTELKFPSEIEFLSVEKNQLLLGSASGLYIVKLKEEGGFEVPIQKFNIPLVAYISPINEFEYFIGTRGTQQFIVNLGKNEIRALPVSIRDVNHVYYSKENDLWISSSDGLYLVKENIFTSINPDVDTFIECISEDVSSGLIYYAIKESLFSYNSTTKVNKVLLTIPDGYFQSMTLTKDGLWLANSFKIFLYQNGKILKEFDFSKGKKFVTEVIQDTFGNVWFLIPGDPKVFWIDPEHVLHEVRVEKDGDGFNNVIFADASGVYLARKGSTEYLFYKSTTDSFFRDISVPLAFSVGNDFNVGSIAKVEHQIWLGSSEGLLRINKGKLEKVDAANKHLNHPILTLQSLDSTKLIMGNFEGLVVLDRIDGYSAQLGESFGLPSSSIPRHGIAVKNNKEVLAGTSRGLSSSKGPITGFEKSPKPKFLQWKIGGRKQSLSQKRAIEYGQLVSITVSSITFPENEVYFQYRLTPSQEWIDAEGNVISFSGLHAGLQQVEVRSRKLGLYAWSDPSVFVYETIPPFWQRWWFYGAMVIGAISIGILTSKTLQVANLKKQRRLELLIERKTGELRRTNTDLVNLNAEKNNLIAIVAHDLRSPLTEVYSLAKLIKFTTKVEGETEKFLDLIESSANRGVNLISKILDIEAIDSRKFKLKIESVNLSELLRKAGERFQLESSKKNIQIEVHVTDSVTVQGDDVLLHQIIDNLVSNAVKFSPRNKNVSINLLVKNQSAIAEIKDEGPGLSAEDKKKLFSKFQKLSARPTAGEASSGLGLYISKSFIETMHGQLWCESELNKGASFFISLPVNSESAV